MSKQELAWLIHDLRQAELQKIDETHVKVQWSDLDRLTQDVEVTVAGQILEKLFEGGTAKSKTEGR
jgi:hypothetical protein